MYKLDELIKYQNNPESFIEHFCLKNSLKKFQYNVIDIIQNERFNFFIKCRQLGFTTLGLGFAYWTATFKCNSTSIIFINNFSYASHWFTQKIREWHLNNTSHVFSKNNITESTNEKLIFANGARIKIVPYTINAVNGEIADLMIMDEFGYCNNLLNHWKAYFPCVANGKIFAYSSLPKENKRNFLEFYNEIDNSEIINLHTLPWIVDETKNYNWYKKQVKLIGKRSAAIELDCRLI